MESSRPDSSALRVLRAMSTARLATLSEVSERNAAEAPCRLDKSLAESIAYLADAVQLERQNDFRADQLDYQELSQLCGLSRPGSR